MLGGVSWKCSTFFYAFLRFGNIEKNDFNVNFTTIFLCSKLLIRVTKFDQLFKAEITPCNKMSKKILLQDESCGSMKFKVP